MCKEDPQATEDPEEQVVLEEQIQQTHQVYVLVVLAIAVVFQC